MIIFQQSKKKQNSRNKFCGRKKCKAFKLIFFTKKNSVTLSAQREWCGTLPTSSGQCISTQPMLRELAKWNSRYSTARVMKLTPHWVSLISRTHCLYGVVKVFACNVMEGKWKKSKVNLYFLLPTVSGDSLYNCCFV